MSIRTVMQAVYRAEPPDDASWESAVSYPLSFSRDRAGEPAESGTVRLSWNEGGLCVLADLEDSVLVAQNRQDEQLHYLYGDVFELFVKPLNEPYKWEMYATPRGNKSTLFFPEWPTDVPPEESLRNHEFRGLDVSVQTTSEGWRARMFVPEKQLAALGASWGPGSKWSVLCGRYNYDESLEDPELSMVPALSQSNFHLTNEYAELEFLMP